jgi:DMSO/TMAO reductase YedYZ molybdopterin-dependent catalytic subunit
MTPPVSRGFRGRGRGHEAEAAGRVPPGQYLTPDFPVLSAGPTPHQPTETWSFEIRGEVDEPRSWTWEQFTALPNERITVDIHCVTKWSKLDTSWRGVSLDTVLDGIDTSAEYVLAFCDGGYTSNLPLADVRDGKAWIAYEYEDEPLDPQHGGPARLLVPRHYFWKSAKWVRGIELRLDDAPGFWEGYGYHNYGDPWKEQRYAGD